MNNNCGDCVYIVPAVPFTTYMESCLVDTNNIPLYCPKLNTTIQLTWEKKKCEEHI